MRQWEDGSRARTQAPAGLSKEQVSKIIGIVLTAVIALLAVFGYQVVVINPGVAAIATEVREARQALSAGVTLDGAPHGVAEPGLPCPCATAAP